VYCKTRFLRFLSDHHGVLLLGTNDLFTIFLGVLNTMGLIFVIVPSVFGLLVAIFGIDPIIVVGG